MTKKRECVRKSLFSIIQVPCPQFNCHTCSKDQSAFFNSNNVLEWIHTLIEMVGNYSIVCEPQSCLFEAARTENWMFSQCRLAGLVKSVFNSR